jgi:DNA-binding MarR family transcriptional regulator
MNVAQLATLNRKLRYVLLLASSKEGQIPSAGQVAIFEDIYKHSPTTTQDVTKRTKLAQSFVSKTVSNMKQKGVVKLRHSRTDKRNIIITFNPALSGFVQMMSERPIRDALKQLLPETSEADIEQVDALLDELAALLTAATK